MGFSRDILPFGLYDIGGGLLPLLSDPQPFPEQEQPYSFIGIALWSRDMNPAVRRIDRQMQVLDGLPLNLYVYAVEYHTSDEKVLGFTLTYGLLS